MRTSSLSQGRPDGPSWSRAVLLIPLIWWTLTLGSGSSRWCFVDFVNLAFHEAGHLFLSPFGTTVHYLGGTIGQLLVPSLLVLYFLSRERQLFAAAVCAWWIGQNFVNIAIYMGDARSLSLPLVGGGDHDWNELFYRFGMLAESTVHRISTVTHLFGVLVMLVGLAWSAYFVLPKRKQQSVREGLTSRRWSWLSAILEP